MKYWQLKESIGGKRRSATNRWVLKGTVVTDSGPFLHTVRKQYIKNTTFKVHAWGPFLHQNVRLPFRNTKLYLTQNLKKIDLRPF